jgi:lantibiotic modifying enzyme
MSCNLLSLLSFWPFVSFFLLAVSDTLHSEQVCPFISEIIYNPSKQQYFQTVTVLTEELRGILHNPLSYLIIGYTYWLHE